MRLSFQLPVLAAALGAALAPHLVPVSRAQDGAVEEWRWPERLTPEQVAELAPLRDRYREQLAQLGPTAEERLEKIRTTPDDEALIRERIDALDYHRRQGSARQIRNVRNDQLVTEFGLPAIPMLVQALSDRGYWARREAAQALGYLCDGPDSADARWLCFQLQAPERIIALYGQGPESELVGLNLDLDRALQSIFGGPPPDASPISEVAVTRVALTEAMRLQESWSRQWSEAHRQWLDQERQRDQARRELLKKLELIQEGAIPTDEGR